MVFNKFIKVSTKNLSLPSVLLIFITFVFPLGADSIRNAQRLFSDEFATSEIIKPALHLRDGRKGTDFFGFRLEHHSPANELILRYTHEGEDVIIDLKLNEILIPQDHFMRYQLPNGTDVVQRFSKSDVDMCHYQGTIRNNTSSIVSLSTCHGIKGVIFDGHETYYIDSPDNVNFSSEHFLYRESNRIKNQEQNSTCGYNEKESLKYGLRHKRSSDNLIRGPYNAKLDSLFVEVVLVVDKSLYVALDKDLKRIHSYCKDIINIVNAAFNQINIFVALVGVVVWSEENGIEVTGNSDKLLDNFLGYRYNILNKNHPNDAAYLLTAQQFDGGLYLGVAYVETICSYEKSGAVVSVVSDKYQNAVMAANTVAHEMGHNFGMEHDTSACQCEGKYCIMEESARSVLSSKWSSCSIKQLSLSFERGMNYCLKNKPTRIFDMDTPKCGNGFVESGEECDCGLPEFCENPCCNANICMFHQNASCATGECCDLTTCRLRTQGTECRAVNGECDLAEHCTGDSEYCPGNIFKRDTELCGGGKAYCYKGDCQSHTDQCKRLWGEESVSVDQCYGLNSRGDSSGNCGFNMQKSEWQKCYGEDVMCGSLQCQSTPNKLLKIEGVLPFSVNIEKDDKNYTCYQASTNLRVAHPGLTPNGAMCGEGKMCLDQKCLSIESLRLKLNYKVVGGTVIVIILIIILILILILIISDDRFKLSEFV